MKVNFYKKITEADDIQNGNGETNASQDTNTTNTDNQEQPQEKNTDTTELDSQVVQLMNRKTALKNQYAADLKVFNDQIVLIQKQKSGLESTTPENDEQAQANKAKILQMNVSLVDLMNKKLVRKNTFNNDIKAIEQQLVTLNKDIAEAGGNIDVKCIDESERVRVRFGRKLFEAAMNRTDEMYAAIKLAFDSMESLSYTPSDTQCRTFAKNTIAYLNRIGWESGENENNFKTFMYGLLNASHLSFGNGEKAQFVENLMNIMKESTLFNWVFANKD